MRYIPSSPDWGSCTLLRHLQKRYCEYIDNVINAVSGSPGAFAFMTTIAIFGIRWRISLGIECVCIVGVHGLFEIR